MKTCCPGCQTIFRVTPEQLKARAGKVRCGQCRRVFNALDSLLDDAEPVVGAPPATAPDVPLESATPLHAETPLQAETRPPSDRADEAAPAVAALLREEIDAAETGSGEDDEPAPADAEPSGRAEPFFATYTLDTVADSTGQTIPEAAPESLAESARVSPPTDSPPMATGRLANGTEIDAIRDAEHGLLPRENKDLPGYDRWLEGAISQPAPPVAGKALAAPFVIVIVLLVLTLIGQTIFHFRGVIALTTPSTRPALAALSAALGTDIPLPRHVDLVSIEASDLQSEPGRNKQLMLQATLRNRASYAQAYPAIELTLTDSADKPIVRRVFMADEYLAPAQLAEKSFAANADVEVRLWLDASEVKAAGYRLYVFYP
ncbi:DUF3426 domain-containing protein [Candidatus Accumulibacter sp. ACC007]|uniref:DUF3426 domain-containing protein n=1 Tax=Candidatus Accumulibacter sp. ACC007 TaxID=2823333 RepID=UPI0025C0B219|nr:DUF3426 domain-containing protein [Candidatus Accumulibacter sp. ACC007]